MLLPALLGAVAVTAAAAVSDKQASPGQALQEQIDAAISQGAAQVTIPPGVYNFTVDNLNISGATNMKLVAAGVAIWFAGNSRGLQPGVNISNCEGLHVSGLAIDYYGLRPSRSGHRGITYNLLNSTDVVSEDITIYKAPFFSVTAFNGGGGHVFRRVHMPNDPASAVKSDGARVAADPWPHQRDAFHFTDLRRGVLVEDCNISGFGDDFFNSHNTAMLVLARESSTSLLLINPHLQNVEKANGPHAIIQNKNTVYGTNCVLENLRQGDAMHFFGWPKAGCESGNGGPGPKSAACTEEDFIIKPLSGSCVVLGSPTVITDNATLEDAAVLASDIMGNHSTATFDASDIWRVRFSSALPEAVARGSLVNIDSFSTPGTTIRNNVFAHTKYNLGRFKSNGGVIVNNTFSHAGVSNLEISPLLTYFEGNIPLVRDVVVSGNTISGEGTSPIHCSSMCGRALPAGNTAVCPLCSNANAFSTNVSVFDNRILPTPTGDTVSGRSLLPASV